MKQHLKQGVYKHFKGGFYKMIGIARHEETDEELVVYCEISRGLETGEGPLWVQSRSRFTEEVEYRGKVAPRFQYVSAT